MTSGTSQPWPVEVLPIGAASAGAVAWRRSGKLQLSAIVKATFAFAPSAVMTPTLPAPLRTAEVPNGEDPESSIREAVDNVPELRRADVTFAGHACAPAATPVPRVAVRLAVRSAAGRMLVDKSLEVLGDRLFLPSHPPPEPTPFTRIPMIYERAYGGPDYGTNPVGIGQIAELAGRRRLPNIVHPEKPSRAVTMGGDPPYPPARPAVEPAGFAPISSRWPVRRRMLRGPARHLLELRIAEIPDTLDPAYFQAAPADQQTSFLQGDEWIILEGLHPVRTVLETQLPGARGVARVYLPGSVGVPIPLVADMLFIDGDAEQCSITWRGSFPLPSEADLPATSILAGVELPGRPVPLPERAPQPAPIPAIRGVPPPLPQRQSTVVIDASPAIAPPAQVAAPAKKAPLDGTMVLTGDEVPQLPPLPVRQPPAGRQKTTVITMPDAGSAPLAVPPAPPSLGPPSASPAPIAQQPPPPPPPRPTLAERFQKLFKKKP